ncbi:ROK family transcriptional regulator [Pseudoprimorskyibacter insulae]|uniref:N-acetylglucosamine repressor n=1 Tax=Pseudoprimorskyibacter insulae TaxID=1695997 RepID=A0A2R8AQ55_9RHOB|nr:ROK family transcriptional regulator [Pseudoprimorskyibacter insulae]SPF78216.1 N-acetylglucosamine repressor [Pseudoprimorskyibacter insulae]
MDTDDDLARQPKPSPTAVTSSKLRNHNERAFLTSLRTQGPLSGAELAKAIGVSAQTASVLTRALEAENLIVKEAPVKGKVGKPQVPIALNPDGAFALGLRFGRRGADLILLDLLGQPRARFDVSYRYPSPKRLEAFVRDGLRMVADVIGPEKAARITGIGVGAPFELWNWIDALGASRQEAEAWRGYSFETAFAEFTDLPVFVANDINMACNGELLFGVGATLSDFGYLYVGSFVGGGLVLNGQVFQGARGNAGAFGSIPIGDVARPEHQLIHQASTYRLERLLSDNMNRDVNLREDPNGWNGCAETVEGWIADTAQALAIASVSVCAILDLPAVVIDGGLPPAVRTRLVLATRAAVARIDRQGIYDFEIIEGILGREAGALGAAFQPLLSAHFLEGSALR